MRNTSSNPSTELRRRIWVERVQPEVDGGKWPAKRIAGERCFVEADLVCDGHDELRGVILYRLRESDAWSEAPLALLVNDRYQGSFELSELGFWQFTIEAWVDEFATWRQKLEKKVDAEQDVSQELLMGAELVDRSADQAPEKARQDLEAFGQVLRDASAEIGSRIDAALDPRLAELMDRNPIRTGASTYAKVLEVHAARSRAQFSAWYELFPRSTGEAGKHGTFGSVEALLPYVASLGFDVLYLPPVHPIGKSYRKGKNNALIAEETDPGSPWAIGSEDGGHKAIHPELGTISDFRRLVDRAKEYQLEIALDIAFQVSPDHPYVREHPEWFEQRPDGSIQYAENPPKKYQDIYPFDFDCAEWQSLWQELRSVFLFWIEQGVRIFRVDNPHTKQLSFWAWCLRDLHEAHPDLIFLAEAFTRPKLMFALAKAGFSQSYTYFTWRETGAELREYMTELLTTDIKDFLRPNFWPNTPDILPQHLQYGGRPAFIARLVLAATLSSSYGIYGPAFELMERVARPGSEEYIDNEKYELKIWNLEDPGNLAPIISRINRVRRDHAALQSNRNLQFHRTDNPELLCFSKHADNQQSLILVVVNLDFHNPQSGWLDLDLESLGIGWEDKYQVHDLLTDARYLWHGPRNYVKLEPHELPAHVFSISLFVRRESDFDYFA